MSVRQQKQQFEKQLKDFVQELSSYFLGYDNQWSIKGFIDCYKNIYTLSSDTKIISKIFEIHLFPKLLEFAERYNFMLIPASCQNYYPDISLVRKDSEKIRFALDIKTTYSVPEKPEYCNGFTLGSHGEYFISRSSTKNIQFPYNSYLGHYCLGAIYHRPITDVEQTRVYKLDELQSIPSVIKDIRLFVAEKWKIASDKQGSGNTANIGSIKFIPDILAQNGTFSRLGEKWFDDYWMNYGKITVVDENGKSKTIRDIESFLRYRNGNVKLIVKPNSRRTYDK